MAAALVGGFLSASLQVLFDRLASPELVNFFRARKHDHELLKKLKLRLLGLNAVLDDAEDEQITNPAVKDWLDELKDVVYHADDLLDDIATEALRCKSDEQEYQSGPNQMVGKIVEIGRHQHDAIEQIGFLKVKIDNEKSKDVVASQRSDFEASQTAEERARADSEAERARNSNQLRLATEERAKASEKALKLAKEVITKLEADLEDSRKAKKIADFEISKVFQVGKDAALENYVEEVPKFENQGFKHGWLKALTAVNVTLAQSIPYEQVDVEPLASDPED
ncbi:uncharacterized protein LOC114279210 [Camellia sinensis]|uniref:uncharacterized protein LOC114279210 n=1 Tax=Camellia sinensis TaxID=4442 RepID=UPI001035BB8B|nr:uncharacterized protein LOC114279210 [Camellia sinensis]